MSKSIQKEYDQDFYAWTIHNAKLLRAGKLSENQESAHTIK